MSNYVTDRHMKEHLNYGETTNIDKVRVLIADDHVLVRAGFRHLLQSIENVQVVGEANNGHEALHMIETLRPDIVMMDIHMGEMSGLEALAKTKRDFPEVRVIILSMDVSEEHVTQALRAGASGYLPKDVTPEELTTAILSVAQGDEYLNPQIAKRLVKYMQRTGDELTPRQREILLLIAKGFSTKEIAYKLNLSAKTVEAHRAQLMERLNIHDIPSLVRYAIRKGILDPHQ